MINGKIKAKNKILLLICVAFLAMYLTVTLIIVPSYIGNMNDVDEFQILNAREFNIFQVTDTEYDFETTPKLGADTYSTIIVYTSSENSPQSQGEIYAQRIFGDNLIGSPIRVSDVNKHCKFNDISGNSIVYTAYETVTSLSGQVRVFDILTGDTIALTDYILVQEARIHGERVVWVEGFSGATYIMLYDPQLSTEYNFHISGYGDDLPHVMLICSSVEIGENFVVWEEYGFDRQYDIWAFEFWDPYVGDLDPFPVTINTVIDERHPSISGDIVVWEERDPLTEGTAIVTKHIDFDEKRTVVDDGNQNLNPSIDSNFVLYESNAAGNFDIYLYDLSEQETYPVTTSLSDERMPDIFENYITFTADQDIFAINSQFLILVPPVAVDDFYTVDGGTVLTINAPGVLSNDYDGNGELKAYLSESPYEGRLVFNIDGSFTYTPDSFLSYYGGFDCFFYRVNNGLEYSRDAIVTITVNRMNRPPEPIEDYYAIMEDTELVVGAPGVLANDWDEDGDQLEAYLRAGPSYGSLVFNIDGSFIYTPNPTFYGADRFEYTVSDGKGHTSWTYVWIDIYEVNDPPVANDDSYSVDEDNILNVRRYSEGILGNDYDEEGDHLFAYLVSGPGNGSLVLDIEGYFSYTPDLNFNGVDFFKYHIRDSYIYSNIATVNITVNPVNDAPVAMNDSFSVNEDNMLIISTSDILNNDFDVDGDPINVVLDIGPQHGSLMLSSDGFFTYTPSLNFNGLDSFTYAINDGLVDSNIAEVIITINTVNDPPEAVDDTAMTDEDSAVSINVLANDSDIEGDPLTIDSVDLPSHGTAIISNNMIIYTPNEDFIGIDSFEYTIIDGQGGNNTAVCTVTVQDKTPPITTHTLEGTSGDNGWYISSVNITLYATDTFSCIAYTEYRIEGDSWVTYSGKIEIFSEGVITLYYRSADDLGNIENKTTITIKIDNTAPETELIITDGYTDEVENLYVTYSSSFVIVGLDSHSGIKQSFYSINSSEWVEYFEPFHLTGVQGEYIIEYYSMDFAGNIELVNSTSVILTSEFEEQYQGFGLLRINGQKFVGAATLSLSENTIQVEVEDQIITWDIVCNYEFRNIEVYTGEGELGRIIVIVISCGSSTYVMAFGTGVFFFEYM